MCTALLVKASKGDLRDALLPHFPDAPAEVVEVIDDLVRQAWQHRGDLIVYSDYLDITVHATA